MKFDSRADYLFHISTNEDKQSIQKLEIASTLLQLLGFGTGFEMIHQLPDNTWSIARHWLYVSISSPDKAVQLVDEINSALAGLDLHYSIETLRSKKY